MLVLDSNTISYYFRGDAQVVPRMQALPPAELGVPAIVEYELRYGLLRLPPEAGALPPGRLHLIATGHPETLQAAARRWLDASQAVEAVPVD